MVTQTTPDSKNKGLRNVWSVSILAVVGFEILARVLKIGLPENWAICISVFVLGVAGYPIRSENYTGSFLKWCVRVFLLSALLMPVLIGLHWLFPRFF